MDKPSKEQILASSSGWVATLLNFLRGLGSGYLYKLRWRLYFVTVGVATAWILLDAFLNGKTEPKQKVQIIGIGGLF